MDQRGAVVEPSKRRVGSQQKLCLTLMQHCLGVVSPSFVGRTSAYLRSSAGPVWPATLFHPPLFQTGHNHASVSPDVHVRALNFTEESRTGAASRGRGLWSLMVGVGVGGLVAERELVCGMMGKAVSSDGCVGWRSVHVRARSFMLENKLTQFDFNPSFCLLVFSDCVQMAPA